MPGLPPSHFAGVNGSKSRYGGGLVNRSSPNPRQKHFVRDVKSPGNLLAV